METGAEGALCPRVFSSPHGVLPSGIPVASAETRCGDVQMKYAECHSVADIVREVSRAMGLVVSWREE